MFLQKVGTEDIFETGIEFNISIKVGESQSQEEIQKTSTSLTVEVPTYSRCNISLIETRKEQKLFIDAPLDIYGLLSGEFSDSVSSPKEIVWFIPDE
ncbi:hypothetical protein [Bacillus cereus]|uniref:hypothetical protein n=1 Tax=Bacillus cereus TaxID=1396 RepID=UPI0013D42180|nr:hypothetical protein [Bacillus cereus]